MEGISSALAANQAAYQDQISLLAVKMAAQSQQQLVALLAQAAQQAAFGLLDAAAVDVVGVGVPVQAPQLDAPARTMPSTTKVLPGLTSPLPSRPDPARRLARRSTAPRTASLPSAPRSDRVGPGNPPHPPGRSTGSCKCPVPRPEPSAATPCPRRQPPSPSPANSLGRSTRLRRESTDRVA